MSIDDKPRNQWSDADIAADQLRRRIQGLARRAREAAVALDMIAAGAADLSAVRAQFPAARLVEEVMATVYAASPGGVLGTLVVDAAEADALYVAERRAAQRAADPSGVDALMRLVERYAQRHATGSAEEAFGAVLDAAHELAARKDVPQTDEGMARAARVAEGGA